MDAASFAKIFRRTVWLTLAVVAGSAFFWDLYVFLGAVAGGALAAGNIFLLKRILEVGARADTPKQGWLTALFFFKFAALIALVYVLVVHTHIDVVAFAVGLSASIVALFAETLRSNRPTLSVG
jgi:hypothetical protein